MRYSLTFTEPLYKQLTTHLFNGQPDVERAAYLLCRLSVTPAETRLLVREVSPVPQSEVMAASSHGMSIPAVSFARAMKRAHDTQHCFAFVHSHPGGIAAFSRQDDVEERKLFDTAAIRVGPGPHLSLVVSDNGDVAGRVWFDSQPPIAINQVRVVGRMFRFLGRQQAQTSLDIFDRQVRAFGHGLQELLHTLTVGVVGVGGTGSAVCEQLIRLGVGHLQVFDGDLIDGSNVTRVYGSGIGEVGVPKVENIRKLAERIGLGTHVTAVPQFITYRSAAQRLKECDIVFGCTDDEWGRSILNRLAFYYYIPVIDMGVRIASTAGIVQSIQGRVTVLAPGTSCLFCRGRIGGQIAAEVLRATDPRAAEGLRHEGYIPELEDGAPSVVSFTTAVASSAVIEFIQRLTGFMGADRTATEILHLFDENRTRTNSRPSDPDCICSNPDKVGRGDSEPFLDSTWRPEPTTLVSDVPA
jgi:molybdopterin/thiamine biosynthesis adenylyltransferase